MKNSLLFVLPTVLFFMMSGDLAYVAKGQDFDELGTLPPLPDLDLGDPDRKMSVWQRAKANRRAAERRAEESSYTRSPEEGPQLKVSQRMRRGYDENAKRHSARTKSTQITVENNIDSNDAVTASGSRLRPFGSEEDYWGDAMYQSTPEESLIELPPLPDLRTPDQVTWMERYRNHRQAKFKQRKAMADAAREAKEMERQAVVERAMRDPNSALIQVESQSNSFGNYVGNSEAPVTPNNGTLRPFDANSTYVKDQQLVYRGNSRKQPVEAWWEQGTGHTHSSPEEGESKWRWTNPFRSGGDRYEKPVNNAGAPVSHGDNGPVGAYSGGDPTLDATPLTSNLQGIVIVPNTRAVSKRVSGVSGIQTNGVDLPPKVRAALDARIGESLTLGSLNQMVRAAVLAYRKSDMPVVDVLVPEQEISTGVLQLVIIEGRLGDVIVEGTSNRHESKNLASQIHLERGEVIRESQLFEDLNWINKHPSRQVDLIYSPGQNYGETDIILRSQQYRALSAYMAYENSGTTLLGQSRALFGASWTGPLFWDMNTILSYQFITNFDNESNLWGHSGVYATYLPWGHQVTLLGAYVESDAIFTGTNGATAGNFNSVGINKQLSGRYAIPLKPFGRVAHELEIGMDFKSSNSDLNFDQAAVFNTISEIVQYSLGYNIVARDRTGSWRIDTEVISSPGNATNKNTDAIFASQRVGASANYTYGRVVLQRDQTLVAGWTGFGRLQVQQSNGNLLGSETLGAGGYDSVRGFEQRVTRGDNGFVGSLEVRTPTVSPASLSGFANRQDALMGLVFYDFANLSNADPLIGETDIGISSVGVGFRYQLEKWFSLRVDYGVQINDDVNDGRSGRWHVGARATF